MALRLSILRILPLLAFMLLGAVSVKGQQYGGDSTAIIADKAGSKPDSTSTEHADVFALIKESEADLSKGDYHKALVQLRKSLKLKKTFRDKQTLSKLYYNMAVAFMNMKMYPQALKYYYKAGLFFQEAGRCHCCRSLF